MMSHLAVLAFEPTALIAWALMGAVILCYRRREWTGLWSALTVLFILFTLASPITANLLLAALEDRQVESSSCHTSMEPTSIVVLAGGIKVNISAPDRLEGLHAASFRRAIAAARLANKSPDLFLIVSGGSGGTVKEAELMSSLIVHLGVSPTRIIRESSSLNTYESAVSTQHILDQMGQRKIILVTSAIHIPRAVATFEKQNLLVCPHAVDYRWVKPDLPGALIPQITALQKSTDTLHEFGGLLLYALRGWI